MQIEQVFEGLDLSEDTVEKIKTIFEAAVTEKAKELAEKAKKESEDELKQDQEKELADLKESHAKELAEAHERYETAGKELIEQYNATVSDLETKADAYLTESVKTWISENSVELQNKMKMQRMESFVSGMRTLFVESGIEIPDENFEIVEAAEANLAKSISESKVLLTRINSLSEDLEDANRKLAFSEVTSDMTSLQVERLKSLSEDIQNLPSGEYKTKLNTIKEAFLSTKEKDSQVTESKQVETKPAKAASMTIQEQTLAALRGERRLT